MKILRLRFQYQEGKISTNLAFLIEALVLGKQHEKLDRRSLLPFFFFQMLAVEVQLKMAL